MNATNVAEKIRGTYLATREQLQGQIQVIEARASELEERAKRSVQTPLRAVWEALVERVRQLLDAAPRQELDALSARVDELSQKLEQLLSGERVDRIRELAEARHEIAKEKEIEKTAPNKSAIKTKVQKTEAPKKASQVKKRS